MQLTTETGETAVSMLAQIVKQTESDNGKQNSAVLGTTANYLMEVATFFNDSNVTINYNVSEIFEYNVMLWSCIPPINIFRLLKM